MSARNVILLIGSPKGSHSTSAALGNFLLNELAARGWISIMFHIQKMLKIPDTQKVLLTALAKAELVVLACPLYVDSLPAAVIRLMERYTARDMSAAAARPRFLALINCGFPENAHNAVAGRICRQFAAENGWHWSGVLSMGEGGAVDGRPITRGGLTRNVARALTLAAEALTADQPISDDVMALMARPLMPAWLYLLVASWHWRRAARARGVLKDLQRQPYPN